MNKIVLTLILFNIATIINARGINGGMSCAVCTVLMGVTMQVAEVYEEDISNATKRMCNYLPRIAQNPCLEVVSDLGPYFENLTEKITPDIFCLAYGTCTVDQGKNLCHLFPLPFEIDDALENVGKISGKIDLPKIDVCKLPLIKDICSILNNSYISLDALEDFDQDGFSALPTARGSDWRGKDCADNDPRIYPGRYSFGKDFSFDSNCNGIFGVDNATMMTFEDLFCKKSKARGLIYIGDSIGAHFHMPEVWINPQTFSWPGLNGSSIILDEIDWPQHGFATGFQNISSNVFIKGTVDSLYLRLRARNRCNHRDYQNLSQNGASSYEGIAHAASLSRNSTEDKPAIVIYAMQGNDVCNNFNDTMAHMTTPQIFRENIMETLSILDSKLPKGSHVVLMGLVRADFIYPAMANKLHPLGSLHKNVYYRNLYEWFSCMEIGPCNGWLNSNSTLRKITTRKARRLTQVLEKIVLEENDKFQHFDLHFIENPINKLVKTVGNISDYLESVDSLHPNQKAQPLLAEVVWKSLETLNILGPENPKNSEIIKIFGNQEGH